MRIDQYDRKSFLRVLVQYARESQTFNPHFHRSEMLARLQIDERTFNILVNALGPRYCRLVDMHGGDDRYAINLAECLSLKDELDREELDDLRHSQTMRLTVLTAILSAVLGAVLGVVLTLWFM